MSNTIMTAKNTFGEGLIMDFAPDNTQANCLTNALNATMLTFNGNEMSLQNDMGNARVETARLPDGYVPVGTCEFGDIIYIVSYNPIINKCLIGCFPSPERNISSEENSELVNGIKWTDFQKSEGDAPNGELIKTSNKYILYEKTLNPGDKYIIYSNATFNEETCKISDVKFKQLNEESDKPKFTGPISRFIKLHVVSIQDSGKIEYLDTSVVEYDSDTYRYFISNKVNDNGKVDIDSYRDLLKSGYSVFKSKISGKLAIFAELERINGFSCTYNVYPIGDVREEDNKLYKDYKTFFEFNWTTDNEEINPSYVVLTDSEWSNSVKEEYALPTKFGLNNYKFWKIFNNELGGLELKLYPNNNYSKIKERHQNYGKIINKLTPQGYPTLNLYYKLMPNQFPSKFNGDILITNDGEEITSGLICDTIINNYYKQGVYKEFADFSIIYAKKEEGSSEFVEYKPTDQVYKYELTPAMAYGLLREYSVQGYIDFNKIGTGYAELTRWKYFNTANNITLNFGVNIYPEPNKGVSEIVLEFYDNLGIAAAYHISDRKSYSGTFTEVIPLNNSSKSLKLNNINANGESFDHKIEIDSNDVNKYPEDKILIKDDRYYYNDPGSLYFGTVYLVKIIVKYDRINALGQFESSNNYENYTYYRWLWTNLLYNDNYYITDDYNDLQFELDLDLNYGFYSDQFEHKVFNYQGNQFDVNYLSKNVGATVQSLTTDINFYAYPLLTNLYGNFLLNDNILNVDITAIEGNMYVEIPESVTYLHTSDNHTSDYKGLIDKTTGSDRNYGPLLLEKLNEDTSDHPEIWENSENYKDDGIIKLKNPSIGENTITYQPYNSESALESNFTLSNRFKFSNPDGLKVTIPIEVDLINFSKYYLECVPEYKNVSVLKSLITDERDLSYYGLSKSGNHIKFDNILTMRGTGGDDHDHGWHVLYNYQLSQSNALDSSELVSLQSGDTTPNIATLYANPSSESIISKDVRSIHNGTKKEDYESTFNNLVNKFVLLGWTDENKRYNTSKIKFTNYSRINNISDSNDYDGLEINYLFKKHSGLTNNFYFIKEKGLGRKNEYDYPRIAQFAFVDNDKNIYGLNTAVCLTNKNLAISNIYLNTPSQTGYSFNDVYTYCYVARYIEGNELFIEYGSLNSESDLSLIKNKTSNINGCNKLIIYATTQKGLTPVKYLYRFYNENRELNDGQYDYTKENEVYTLYIDNPGKNPNRIDYKLNDLTLINTSGWVLLETNVIKEGSSVYNINFYAGDILASILQSLYAIKGSEEIISKLVLDCTYLDNNSTVYTKEIICRTNINNSNSDIKDSDYFKCNLYINLNANINYKTYLTELIDKLSSSEKKKISYCNIALKLNNITKTCPIQFRLDYIKPSFDLYDFNVNCVLYRNDSSEGEQKYIRNFDKNQLYLLNDQGEIESFSANYKFNLCNNFESDINGKIIAVPSINNLSNKYLYNIFNYNGSLLVIEPNHKNTGNKDNYYIQVTYDSKKHILGFTHFRKDDIILPGLELIKP